MRTLLIGLDGFDPFLTRRWMGEGKLPNLSRLAAEGSFSHLESLLPPVSPAVWTSILTGVNPARHGVFDFTIMEGRKVRIAGSFRREAPNIFEMLSAAGQRVLSVGFPAVLPGGKVNGAVISGWSSPFAVKGGKSGCRPAWLHDAVASVLGEEYMPFDVMDQFRAGTGKETEEAIERLERSPLRRAALALYIWRKKLAGPVDLAAVYFPEADAAGHQLWHLADPRSPRRSTVGRPERLGNPLEKVYTRLDQAVGLLVEGIDPDAVVVVSDHGMGGSGDKALSINKFLEQAGLLRVKRGLGSGAARATSRVAVEAVKMLPPGTRELLVRGGAGAVSDLALSFMRLGGIDWSRTLAFSEDLSHAPSIWLNRGAAGGPGPGEDAPAGRIIEALDRVPGSAEAFGSLRRRSELYRGPFAGRIPDILVELRLDGGYSYNLLPGRFRSMGKPVEPLDARLMTGEKGKSRHGSHRPAGTLIVRVPPGAGCGGDARNLEVHDLAPFILSLHGIEIPAYFDTSKSFTGARRLLPGSLSFRGLETGGGTQYFRVRSRLENLGYL